MTGARMPEAIVLAGGEDARLNPLTRADQPKCLLPVCLQPAILYALLALQKAGITSVFVVRSTVPPYEHVTGCTDQHNSVWHA